MPKTEWARTYDWDIPLFAELGLKSFVIEERSWDFVDVGTVERNGATVHVSVACAPAQFWRFVIKNAGDGNRKDYVISTGSGNLSKYWPFIEQILDNMIVIKSVTLA